MTPKQIEQPVNGVRRNRQHMEKREQIGYRGHGLGGGARLGNAARIGNRPVAKVGAYKFCAPNSLKNNNCSHELNLSSFKGLEIPPDFSQQV